MLSRLGDLLFYTIAEGQERIPIHKFTTVSSSLRAQNTYPSGSLESGGTEKPKCRAANRLLHEDENSKW